MKFVVFGGFLMLCSCILLAALMISKGSGFEGLLLVLGTGLIISILGLFKKEA